MDQTLRDFGKKAVTLERSQPVFILYIQTSRMLEIALEAKRLTPPRAGFGQRPLS